MKRIALVTGANRGMGFETCRQLGRLGYTVVLTSRDVEKGRFAADKLLSEGLDVVFHRLDVTDEKSVKEIAAFVEKKFGRLDVLVNNAAIMLHSFSNGDMSGATFFDTDLADIRRTMETNLYGPIRLCRVFVPLMKKNNYGRIVNIGSAMGQLSEMWGGWPGYRISKTAVNALTRILADELKGTNIKVNTANPGWVKTDMGGPHAERPVEEGVKTAVWLATLPDDGPTGGFFKDRQPIQW